MRFRLATPFLVLLVLALPATGVGQTISLKTVPVPNGDQFLLLPSRSLGMGGARIALEDPIADAFANPAKGGRLSGARVFATPTFYDVSDDLGGGASLPVGVLVGGDRWFFGGALAMQQLHDFNDRRFFFPIAEDGNNQIEGGSPSNTYVRGAVGLRLGEDRRTAVGAAVMHAGLSATDGARVLFGGSQRLDQDGGFTDYRMGVVHELAGGGWIEALVLHSRLDMTHEATYWQWVPGPSSGPPDVESWVERNQDRTHTSGVHVGVVRPLAASPGWRVGGIFTFNRKMHPKIPNYSIVNIPRDPGNSTAFNVGAGVSHVSGGDAFALDLVWEPARSHTWAESEPCPACDQVVEKTIENWFNFSNIAFASGFSRDGERAGWQFGLAVKMYEYRLRQENYVEDTTRRTNDSWFEWAPSWGAMFRLGGAELRYSGRLLMRGAPNLFERSAFAVATPDAGGIDVLAAPTSPVFLPEYHTFTNQFSVVIPIGR